WRFSLRLRRAALGLLPLRIPFANPGLSKQLNGLFTMPGPTIVLHIQGPALLAQATVECFAARPPFPRPQAQFFESPSDHVAGRAEYLADVPHGPVVTIAHTCSFLCFRSAWRRCARPHFGFRHMTAGQEVDVSVRFGAQGAGHIAKQAVMVLLRHTSRYG